MTDAAAMTVDDVFWAIHQGLPREAPGSPETADLLLRMVGPLPPTPRVVDMGCGPGTSSILLAQRTGGHVLAVDLHEPFLTEVTERARAAGVERQIRTAAVSMDATGVEPGSVDLVWAEGSAYSIGVDEALTVWRDLLAPGGSVVLTDAEWSTPDPHPRAREFWTEYPAMRSTEENVAAFRRAGWDIIGLYRLPDTDWWAYYGPLAERIGALRRAGAPEPSLAPHEAEITVRREHQQDYAYTGYVLRPGRSQD